jgi:pullulanase/glycogen debranching enzyme
MTLRIWPGQPYPLGATFDGTGTNFSLFSEVAERVEPCLFDEEGDVGRAAPGGARLVGAETAVLDRRREDVAVTHPIQDWIGRWHRSEQPPDPGHRLGSARGLHVRRRCRILDPGRLRIGRDNQRARDVQDPQERGPSQHEDRDRGVHRDRL